MLSLFCYLSTSSLPDQPANPGKRPDGPGEHIYSDDEQKRHGPDLPGQVDQKKPERGERSTTDDTAPYPSAIYSSGALKAPSAGASMPASAEYQATSAQMIASQPPIISKGVLAFANSPIIKKK